MPTITSDGGSNLRLLEAIKAAIESAADEAADVQERIQQQLGQINNDNNLAPGERFEE